MELLKFEARTLESNESSLELQVAEFQLSDLELVLVGGGIGDVQAG